MIKPALALTLALLATSANADTLVTNVNGIQVGADGNLQRFTGLLIDNDGKVKGLLTGPPPPKTFEQTIDGQGRTLLPGLIDAHGHVMNLGMVAIQLDLTGVQSLEEMKSRLAQYATANPKAPWIVGFGWNQEMWADRRMPTAADMDSVVRDRPVWLDRIDGHAAVANSAALKAAGVTSVTADPTGGKVEKDASGQPTGLFIDTAKGLVGRIVPDDTPADLERAFAKAQEAILATGLTAVSDMGTSAPTWAMLKRLGAAGQVKFRFLAYAGGTEQMKAIAGSKPVGWLNNDRLWMGGVKLYADGALGSRGAWLKAPYADTPGSSGLRFLSDEELKAQVDLAASGGFQVATHAIGDAANAQVIGAYEQAGAKYKGDRRWRIEHFQIADPADIGRLARAGIIASMQPTHQTSDRLMAEARLGPNRLAGAYAWQTVLHSGARLAFGSDFPVESPNPFPGLAAAVSRQDMNGQPPGGWQPQQKVTFAQALSGFTRDAAYANFAEKKIGALEPGKWADFIVVDRDVSAVDPQALARTQVLETWLAGKKVWERVPSAGGERGK